MSTETFSFNGAFSAAQITGAGKTIATARNNTQMEYLIAAPFVKVLID
jgi:hypothetical protein